MFYLHIRDISELTQHVNRLEGELNHLSEENEVLRDRLGLEAQQSVDVSGVRARKLSELERLRRDNRMLEKEVGLL